MNTREEDWRKHPFVRAVWTFVLVVVLFFVGLGIIDVLTG